MDKQLRDDFDLDWDYLNLKTKQDTEIDCIIAQEKIEDDRIKKNRQSGVHLDIPDEPF